MLGAPSPAAGSPQASRAPDLCSQCCPPGNPRRRRGPASVRPSPGSVGSGHSRCRRGRTARAPAPGPAPVPSPALPLASGLHLTPTSRTAFRQSRTHVVLTRPSGTARPPVRRTQGRQQQRPGPGAERGRPAARAAARLSRTGSDLFLLFLLARPQGRALPSRGRGRVAVGGRQPLDAASRPAVCWPLGPHQVTGLPSLSAVPHPACPPRASRRRN